MADNSGLPAGFSRRTALKTGVSLLGGSLLTPMLAQGAWAEDYPALGSYPAGVSGSTVFVGACVPLTGTYAAAGEDEHKGFQLAVEHLNSGDSLIKAISPKTTKGVLGKEVKLGVADSEAKPNTAVQAATRFITEDNAMVLTGSVSSAVAVALNKLAGTRKVLYLPGISGSNDTTGKDCSRYSFRACHYAYTASAAIAPILLKTLGSGRKAAYLTPDYTYGHTVFESMKQFTEKGGWTTVINQLSPLGAPDFSSFLLNIANSGADVLVNIGFGNDAVNSIKQAKQFGLLDKMTLVMPYLTPFLAKEVGADLIEGVYGTTEFWWTLGERDPLAKQFVDTFNTRFGYKPEWGAHIAYLQLGLWARAVEEAGTFYPTKVIKAYENGEKISNTTIGDVTWRAADHQLVRPVVVVKGKKKADMKSDDDFYDIVDVVPGEGIIQPADLFGCKMADYD